MKPDGSVLLPKHGQFNSADRGSLDHVVFLSVAHKDLHVLVARLEMLEEEVIVRNCLVRRLLPQFDTL